MKYLLVIMSCWTGLIYAQTCEQRVGGLVGKSDVLELSRYYPTVKDSLSPFMQLVARSSIEIAFNQPYHSVAILDSLVQYYSTDLGASLLSYITLWADELYVMGEYGAAADLLENTIEQLYTMKAPAEYIREIQMRYRICKGLRNTPIMKIAGGEKESKIAMKKKKNIPYIYIDTKINGKLANTFFDTGAVTVVSKTFAQDNSVKQVADSLVMNGQKTLSSLQYSFGVIEHLTIGSFECTNVPCMISNGAIQELDYDLIIGTDILRKFHEVRIYPQELSILFSTQSKPAETTQHNMMIWGKQSYIECDSDNGRMTFSFDTGNNRQGVIASDYFYKYENRIANLDNPHKLEMGASGSLNIYRINPFMLYFGELKREMTEFFFIMGGNDASASRKDPFPQGNVGIGLVNLCEEVILNYEHMYYMLK